MKEGADPLAQADPLAHLKPIRRPFSIPPPTPPHLIPPQSSAKALEYSASSAQAGRTLVLALDVSAEAVASGALAAACAAAAAALPRAAATGSYARVALLTFDHNVAVWRLRGAAPPLSVVLPVTKLMPTPVAAAANLLNLTQSVAPLAALLARLPEMHATAADGSGAAAAAAARRGGGVSAADQEEVEEAASGAALPAAVHTAMALLEGAPGTLVVLSGSGATAGPGRRAD